MVARARPLRQVNEAGLTYFSDRVLPSYFSWLYVADLEVYEKNDESQVVGLDCRS